VFEAFGGRIQVCPIWAILWYQSLGPLRFWLMVALLFFAGFFHRFL
jgi:hypothetical protein